MEDDRVTREGMTVDGRRGEHGRSLHGRCGTGAWIGHPSDVGHPKERVGCSSDSLARTCDPASRGAAERPGVESEMPSDRVLVRRRFVVRRVPEWEWPTSA